MLNVVISGLVAWVTFVIFLFILHYRNECIKSNQRKIEKEKENVLVPHYKEYCANKCPACGSCTNIKSIYEEKPFPHIHNKCEPGKYVHLGCGFKWTCELINNDYTNTISKLLAENERLKKIESMLEKPIQKEVDNYRESAS